MKKILYVSSAIDEFDYPSFLKLWKDGLNTSNQNFHYRMIKALAINNEVHVISLRPLNNNCSNGSFNSLNKTTGNITWEYLKVKNNKYLRYISFIKETKHIIKNQNIETIFVDAMNYQCLKIALKAKKQLHCKLIPILTDNPYNISFMKKTYQDKLIKVAQKGDSFVALTQGLNDLYNHTKKPYVIVNGIVPDKITEPSENKYGKYIFFGGAMMKRYGVYDLIKAYQEINPNSISLLLAGHHYDLAEVNKAINNNKNIKFLGTLPYKEIKQLEENAYININPRPYEEQLDKYSIPSKTIEYASSGRLTISGINTELKKIYGDSLIWIKNNNIKESLEIALRLSDKEYNQLTNKAQEITYNNYSYESVRILLEQLL